MNIPAELKYTKDHEWVKIDGDIATVGITDFAQSELGDIVYVEVDTLDESLDKDAVFCTVEAVKTALSRAPARSKARPAVVRPSSSAIAAKPSPACLRWASPRRG